MTGVLEADTLTRIYRRGSDEVTAVDGASLTIAEGEFISFTGPSGSGKTTLVNLLGCLDNPTAGRLYLDGKNIFGSGKRLSEQELTRIRRETFGYIFQSFFLVPTLTVAENVALPFTFYRKSAADPDVGPLLRMLGIDKRADHLPGQISGGEMQRVAIARALANRPRILIADEPTGNLDSQRSMEIGDVLRDLNRNEGLTVILVTHNPELASRADRTIELRDGRIAGIGARC